MELTFPFEHGVSVQWMHASHAHIPSQNLRRWLLDTGSLTERLQECCDNFSLTRLGQGEVPLYANEKRWLPTASQKSWQIREVVLYGDGAPWVFARSVLPETLITSELANLGTQPLGVRLFNDDRFIRSNFELCEVPASAFDFSNRQIEQSDGPQQTMLWGRRSRFHMGNDYIIVAEIFLPDAPAYKNG